MQTTSLAFGYNPPMRRNLRKIVYLMLAILLATVLSPSFAWEATAGSCGTGSTSRIIAGRSWRS